jgi:hypothetical protein
MNLGRNFHCFQNKNQLKKSLRQLNIMIHRLEQDGYLGGSESVQVVFLYLHHIELPFNIKKGHVHVDLSVCFQLDSELELIKQ